MRNLTNLDIRAVFAVLCNAFALRPYQPRPGARFIWGEEKLRARCQRLKRQLTAIAAERRAATRTYARTMRDLRRRRESCLIELAMADLYALAADRQGKPGEAEPSPGSGAEAAPSLGKAVAVSSDPGNAGTPTLPQSGAASGSGEPTSASTSIDALGSMPSEDPVPSEGSAAANSSRQAPASPDPASTGPADLEADDTVPNFETMRAQVEASAPGWLDVDAPPLSVRERFPLYDLPLASLDLDHLDLNGLLPRLAGVHPDLVNAAPVFSDNLPAWFRSEDGGACRAASEQAIEREVARRDLWNDLIKWYWFVLAAAPGAFLDARTPREADETYGLIQAEFYEAAPTTDRHSAVWKELTSLMPARPWLTSGAGKDFDEGDDFDMPYDDSEGTSAYDDDDDSETAGTT